MCGLLEVHQYGAEMKGCRKMRGGSTFTGQLEPGSKVGGNDKHLTRFAKSPVSHVRRATDVGRTADER